MRSFSILPCGGLKQWVRVATVGWFVTALPAWSQAPEHIARLSEHWNFDINSGSLDAVALEFSRLTRIQVIVSPVITGVSVSGVHGRLSAQEALSALLDGTGLAFTLVGDTVTIHPRVDRTANHETAVVAGDHNRSP